MTALEMIDRVLGEFPDLRWPVSIQTDWTRSDVEREDIHPSAGGAYISWLPARGPHGARLSYREHAVVLRRGLITRDPVMFMASLAHELTHARQAERHGSVPKFLHQYHIADLIAGYAHNRFEVEARRRSEKVMRALGHPEYDAEDWRRFVPIETSYP